MVTSKIAGVYAWSELGGQGRSSVVLRGFRLVPPKRAEAQSGRVVITCGDKAVVDMDVSEARFYATEANDVIPICGGAGLLLRKHDAVAVAAPEGWTVRFVPAAKSVQDEWAKYLARQEAR